MILALSLLATTSIAPSCAEAMARRDAAFRPLAAEMRARRSKMRDRLRETNRYPSLAESQDYATLEHRLAAFQRAYPYRDCKSEQRRARR